MLKTTTRNANFGWQTEPVWRTDHMENRRFKEAPVQPTIFEGTDYTAANKRVNETSDIAVSNIFPYVCNQDANPGT